MSGTTDLTQGNVYKQLKTIALPLIATNFIQTAYNVVDMIWIGRLGSDAVISVGTASFSINMAIALFTLIITGTGIKIAHSFGSKEYEKIQRYIVNGVIMAILMAILYSTFIIAYKTEVINFFNINNALIQENAEKYLVVSMFGTIFMYMNALFASIMNSLGNSKLSFKLNSVGFITNMLLDPILIFGVGGYLKFGVVGAAYASIIGRFIVFILSLIASKKMLTQKIPEFRIYFSEVKEVFIIGIPNAVQRVSFTGIAILMAKLIAGFGPTGIAVQKIGLQVESLSFMTIGGLYGAMSVFIGQNYGANNWYRIKKGYKAGLLFSLIFGGFTTVLFVVFPRQIFSIFIQEETTIVMGVEYLRIIGLSQLFMCIEIVTMASFNGLGKTYIPAIVSLTFTGLRFPAAIMISKVLMLGIDSVWWSISITSMFKGVLLVLLFLAYLAHKTNKIKGGVTNA